MNFVFFKPMSLFFALSASLILSGTALAQNASSKKYDQAILRCLGQVKSPPAALRDTFALFAWAKKLQKNCEAVKDNRDTDVLFEIADQKETIDALVSLSENCAAMQKIQKPLQKIQKIYQDRIKTKEKSSLSDKTFREERSVSIEYADVIRLKVQVNALVNTIQGDNSIFRYFK